MSTNSSDIKNRGIYFTPVELADFVINSIIDNPNANILDPCYGHGALLFSAYQRLINLGCYDPKIHLFGCDINWPSESVLSSLSRVTAIKNLVEDNFFNLDGQLGKKFDVIIMNPPFVRHHSIPGETKTLIKGISKDLLDLANTSDLWAYFVIHSLSYLNSDGRLAAILPWSFLHSDYAQPIRKHLASKFRCIKCLSIGERLFDNTQERIVVLLAEGYGARSTEIKTAYSPEIPTKEVRWTSIEPSMVLDSADSSFSATQEKQYLVEMKKRLNFQPLSDFADVRIGTVTGANGFFVMGTEKATNLGIPGGWQKPILRIAHDIAKYAIVYARDLHDVLLVIPENASLPTSVQSYVKLGEDDKIEKGYHARNRARWYSIRPKEPPDAFLPYMITQIPILVLNPDKVLSTNNIHGVYFSANCPRPAIKWIQMSMLSSISQLSIEISSRTYGSGVLKIEPSAAKQILVFPGDGQSYPEEVSNKIHVLIRDGKRDEAMNVVDDWFSSILNISKSDMNNINKCYRRLKMIRLGTD